MKTSVYVLVFLCASVLLQELPSSSADKDAVKMDPARPVISDVFQVNVEAVFKKKTSAASSVMYYDRPNNRAASQVQWKGEQITEIYNFDTNEKIQIKGYQCTVEDIPSKSDDSFFRFTINATTQEKIIGSPEVALFFEKSEFQGDDLFNEQIPVSIYKANMDIPLYRKTNCSVEHYFSKPIFENPDCESHSCKPALLLLNVFCGETTDNYYNFYNFKAYIENEAIFEAPPGVFCARKKDLPFPTLPDYFSFSYDIVKKQLTTDSIGSTETLHKKLWFYGDRGLIRRDNYDESGLLQAATVFDFNNGVTYSTMASLKECNLGEMTKDISLEKITLLPNIIFPKSFGSGENKSVYAGQRTDHGLVYDVWSMTAKVEEFQTVKDIYFFKNAVDSMKVIKDYEMQLVFIEISDYSRSESDEKKLEKDQVTYIPINNFRSVPKELSVFDVAACFESDQKIPFEIKVEGPVQLKGTHTYFNLFETVQTKLLSIGVSVPRISELQTATRGDSTTFFTAWLLENPMSLGYGKNNSEPNKQNAYKILENLIKTGSFNFNITDTNKEVLQYKATSIRILSEAPQIKGEDGSKKYSAGSMAGVAIAMLIVGLVLGVVGLVVFLNRRERKEKEKLVSS